jgi:hypothetical protein
MTWALADATSDAHEWSVDGMVWTFGSLLVSIAFLAIVAWFVAARYRAKASIAIQASYRKLADDAADAQYQTSARLTAIDNQLTDVSSRLADLEKILCEVE